MHKSSLPSRRHSWMLLLLLCAGPILASAQDDLSLGQLVEMALQENYDIRIYRNIALAAETGNTKGNAGMLPTVDLLAEQRFSVRNTQQQFFSGETRGAPLAQSNATSATLDANWIVFDGMAMFARKDRLDQLAGLSRADTRFFMEQTIADLATAYYDLKQQTQLLATYRKSLDVSKARLAFEEKALEVGASTLLDVQQARVDRNTDSSLVLTQQALLQEISISINRLINRELSAAITPTDSIVLASSFDLSGLMDYARVSNAALSQRQFAELIAMSNLQMSKGALLPQVEVFGNIAFTRQQNQVGILQSNRSIGPEAGVRVRFNLFSGYQDRTAQQVSEINLETEKLSTSALSLEVEESIRIAYLRWQNRVTQLALERESIEAANEALSIAQRQYELGTLTNVDFRIIQLNVINAETRFLEAQLDAKIREVELLRLSGRLLEELQ
ncbi:MAG: TolC family protein [Bacteroidia bacterium]|nr:TolC family protein [Bacteroidia bacterium]